MVLMALFLVPAQVAQAQGTGRIAGAVTASETGQPLTGASVMVVGTELGAVTDANGRHLITGVPAGTHSVRAVLLGFSDGVVADVTGSASAVSGEALGKTPAVNVSNTLGGKLPGIVTVNTSGEPGYDGAIIRIRGNHTLNDNDPLIVIDGVASQCGGCEKGGAACE